MLRFKGIFILKKSVNTISYKIYRWLSVGYIEKKCMLYLKELRTKPQKKAKTNSANFYTHSAIAQPFA